MRVFEEVSGSEVGEAKAVVESVDDRHKDFKQIS